MQARPVGGIPRKGQPDQPGVPAVTLGDAPHHLAHEESSEPEGDEETELPSDAIPVEQDEREDAPDGDIIKAGITQDALADGLAQNVELFQEKYQDRQRRNRTRHTDADDQLPGMPLGPDP